MSDETKDAQVVDPVYREETPTGEEIFDEQIEFALPDELQPGKDLWHNERPMWSQNAEIDEAVTYLNEDIRLHIDKTHDHLVDMMDIKNTKQSERIQIKLDTNVVEMKDETDKINFKIATLESKFTKLNSNVTTLGEKVSEIADSMGTLKDSIAAQNDTLVKAMDSFKAMLQESQAAKTLSLIHISEPTRPY